MSSSYTKITLRHKWRWNRQAFPKRRVLILQLRCVTAQKHPFHRSKSLKSHNPVFLVYFVTAKYSRCMGCDTPRSQNNHSSVPRKGNSFCEPIQVPAYFAGEGEVRVKGRSVKSTTLSSSAEVKNEWRYTSTSPTSRHGADREKNWHFYWDSG
jgi:hypothetical protein